MLFENRRMFREVVDFSTIYADATSIFSLESSLYFYDYSLGISKV